MMEKAVTGSVKKSLNELHKRTFEIQERARKDEEERLETGIVYLPTWREDRRGSPNSFLRSALFAAIQSKDRADLKKAELFSQQGVKITYTGQQLNQEDMTVWLALVDLAKQHPLGTECTFTANSILKYIGLDVGGREHERLSATVDRMTACLVKIEGEKYIYGGSLIDHFVIDKDTKRYKITLNRHLTKLFGDTDWTGINWEQRKKLRNKPLCMKLHEYYSSHQNPVPVSLQFLSDLTGSENKQKADFKRKIKTGLEGLIKVGFLKSYMIEGDIVTVERNSTN
jgi:TrfA protein